MTINRLAIAGLAVAISAPAMAHISYSGRDFGSFTGLDTVGATKETNVTGNYGWADAADDDLGDSHRSRAFRFHLDGAASVTISAKGIERTGGLGGLLPGFSVYSGLAHIAVPPAEGDHDTAATSLAYLATLGGTQPKEGAWYSLGDWKIGSESFPDLSSFTFVGYAADGTVADFINPAVVGDGAADGSVKGTFLLGPGDYSFFVGGVNYAGQPAVGDTTRPPDFGLSVTLDVAPVPEPMTALLMTIGLGALGVARHRVANARSTPRLEA